MLRSALWGTAAGAVGALALDIASYGAAAQEFVLLGQPDLAQVALQVGAIEAGGRRGGRA